MDGCRMMQTGSHKQSLSEMSNWSLDKIQNFLASTKLFGGLGANVLKSLATNMESVSIQKDKLLFRLDDEPDCMYLLAEGLLDVIDDSTAKSVRIAQVHPGECVGELGVLGAGKRTATIIAASHSYLLKLTKENFYQVLNNHSELQGIVRKIMQSRLSMLLTICTKLFGDLDEEILSKIESCLFWRQLKRGEKLFNGLKEENALYLILNGRLQVISCLQDKSECVIAELGRDQWIGEMGILLDEPYVETIRASRDTELIGLTKEGFNILLNFHPEALKKIIKPIANRLSTIVSTKIQNYTKSSALNFALIDLDGGLLPFPEDLFKQLNISGKTLYLNAERFSAVHGKGSESIEMNDPRSTYLNVWFSVQEDVNHYIVMESDAKNPAWIQRCLHQADRVLFVAKANSDPNPRPVENLCKKLAPTTPTELILLHEPEERVPRNTDKWLECRNLAQHHHIRHNNSQDLSRLGRLLTNQGIGLILSGGGARGFAHIGVIKALKEANIPFDYVGGTSIGGVIASLVAWDLKHEVLVDYIKKLLINYPRGFRYTLPYSSLMKVKKAEEKAINLYDGLNIEDFWLHLFAISTNISTADLVIHETGPVWKAMRASTAVPGLFPPVFDNGKVLVDGGILNNLPIDIIEKQASIGHIIASDVTKSEIMVVDEDWREDLSLFEVFFNNLNPFSKKAHGPKASDILTRCMVCTSVMRKKDSLRHTDLYLTPPVSEYSLLEMNKIDQLIELGYLYTLNVLDKTDIQTRLFQ